MSLAQRMSAATIALIAVAIAPTAVRADLPAIWGDRSFDASFNASTRVRQRLPNTSRQDTDEMSPSGSRFYAGAAAVHGYDKNIDLDTRGAQSGLFGLVDLGAGVLVGGAAGETAVIVRGSFLNFNIDERSRRWDGGALFDHHVRLGDDWRATIGGFHFADHIDFNANHRTAGYAHLSRERATHDLFLRMRTLSRQYQDPVGATRLNGDLITVDRSFSNIRTETSAGVLLLKDHRLSPFFQVGAAHVDFTNQAQNPLIDRDAQDVFATAGVRLTVSPQLRLDLGVRHNHREFRASQTGDHASSFFDGKLVWTPSDWLYVEANVDRTFEDPEWAAALFAQRTAATLYANAKISPRLSASAYGGLVRKDHIGAFVHTDDRFFDTKLAYDISERAQIFAIAGTAWTRESATGEKAEHHRTGIGIKIGN